MTDIAIRVDKLGKMYRIGRAQQRHDTLRDVIGSWRLEVGDWVKRLRHSTSNLQPPTSNDTIWALRDVSFEVRRGEVVGIIGRNGAGKSTLLKILSRITEPTTGRAEIHGRVGSLLEVGTGFHPELTGRENIYLNGAILGMKKTEIDRQFDEIVAFAEIAQFLDTPVKRYSSGMYVRLAFAVAAHLEPEILLVDEVLAVGDAAFQKKCLGKMGDVAQEGRTILLVSHNMAAISGLSQRVATLDQGSLVIFADPASAIGKYLRLSESTSTPLLSDLHNRRGEGPIRFTSFHCEGPDGTVVTHLVSGQYTKLVLGFSVSPDVNPENLLSVVVAIAVYDSAGYKLTNLSNHYFQPFEMSPSSGQFMCEIERLPLRSGQYVLELYCQANGLVSDWIHDVQGFEVSDGDYYETGRITYANQGAVFLDHAWSVNTVHEAPAGASSRGADDSQKS